MHLLEPNLYTSSFEPSLSVSREQPRAIPMELATRPRVQIVREDLARYSAFKDEGSEVRTIASIAVPGDARWTAMLTVQIPDHKALFIQLERSGELPLDYRGAGESAIFSVPLVEAEAIFLLLSGIAAQARRDEMLRGA